MTLDLVGLNEARWVACNTQYRLDGRPPTMEWCSELADKIVAAYLKGSGARIADAPDLSECRC